MHPQLQPVYIPLLLFAFLKNRFDTSSNCHGTLDLNVGAAAREESAPLSFSQVQPSVLLN